MIGRPVALTSAESRDAFAALSAAGLVVEVGAGPPAEALLARHGRDATARARARARTRVALDASPTLRARAEHLLATSGLAVVEPGGPGDGAEPDVVLLAAERELGRERTDAWMRSGVPHLALQAHDGGITLGPFVVPGVTACMRCLDAEARDADPRRPVVLDQLARRPGPAPLEETTVVLALAWAVRDLALWAEGERPSTWSATVALDTAGSEPVTSPRPWRRHPHCGCAWEAWPVRLARAVAAG